MKLKYLPLRIEITLALFLGKIMAKKVPLKNCLWLIGKKTSIGATVEVSQKQMQKVLFLGWYIRHCSKVLPWSCVCLDTGYALSLMLNIRKISHTFHFGVNTEDKMCAHAWVKCDSEIVMGKETDKKFVELSTYIKEFRSV